MTNKIECEEVVDIRITNCTFVGVKPLKIEEDVVRGVVLDKCLIIPLNYLTRGELEDLESRVSGTIEDIKNG